MIGPVYGQDKKTPIGVIQFINKNEGIIDDKDIARFDEISELIGMCIENTNTITKTVGVTFQFAACMEKINNIMKEQKQLNDQNPPDELIKQIQMVMKEIRDKSKEFIESRTKNA